MSEALEQTLEDLQPGDTFTVVIDEEIVHDTVKSKVKWVGIWFIYLLTLGTVEIGPNGVRRSGYSDRRN
jgi:hypothetical protein